MAFQLVADIRTGAGIIVDLSTTDDVYVSATGQVGSTDSTGIRGTGSAHVATIAGFVGGGLRGIQLGDNGLLDSDNYVLIEASGVVHGYPPSNIGAVNVSAFNSDIVNNGRIFSTGAGISMWGGSSVTDSSIVNRGTITASMYGIFRYGGSTETLVVTNSGTITGGDGSFESVDTSIDIITNSGTMIGDIRLNGANDSYTGTAGRLIGKLYGGDGDDKATGGINNDWFEGGNQNDTLNGKAGDDQLFGQQGIDVLIGEAGADVLNGGTESDTLTGGLGVDTLTGGLGNDFFVFATPVTAANLDKITDFSNVSGNNDTIRLENAYFTKIGNPGVLRSTAFKLSTQVKDADDRIVYNKAAGLLYYDPDGSGAAAQVLIAQFTSTVKPTLTYADFVVI